MKYLSFAASAFLLTSSALTLGPAVSASASPMSPIAAAPHHAIVPVLCRYGSPHCVNPHPGPKPPKVGGAKLPDSNWEDPDCKYYGSCGTGNPGNWGDPSHFVGHGSSMPQTGTSQPGFAVYR